MQGRLAGRSIGRVRRYLILLRVRHGARLVAGGTLERLGGAAVDLVILLALRHATGSFALGGAAVAALTVAMASSTILQGRLMDRFEARTVLAPLAAGVLCALFALATAVALRAPGAALVALAAVVGTLVPAAGTCSRASWSALLRDADERATAFAWESLSQDVGFVVGPAALGAVAESISPVAALGCCGALIAVGSGLVAAGAPAHGAAGVSAISEAPDRDRAVASIARALGAPAVALIAVGAAVGAMEVSATAFAVGRGAAAAAGALLGAFSLGSAAGGLLYGARRWRAAPERRLLACCLALAGGLALPALAPSVPLAAAALLLAGAPLAAALTTAFLLADVRVPAARRTEAFAWLSVLLNAGVALGSALAGITASGPGPRTGFLQAAAAALLAATTLVAAARRSAPSSYLHDPHRQRP